MRYKELTTANMINEANFSCDWNDMNLDKLTAMLKLRIRRDRPPNWIAISIGGGRQPFKRILSALCWHESRINGNR
jgi:hypothetical protein